MDERLTGGEWAASDRTSTASSITAELLTDDGDDVGSSTSWAVESLGRRSEVTRTIGASSSERVALCWTGTSAIGDVS